MLNDAIIQDGASWRSQFLSTVGVLFFVLRGSSIKFNHPGGEIIPHPTPPASTTASISIQTKIRLYNV